MTMMKQKFRLNRIKEDRMMKKFILALTAAITMISLSGCSSGGSGGSEEIVAEEGLEGGGETISEDGGAGEVSLEGDIGGDATAQTADTTAAPDTAVADTASEEELSIEAFNDGSNEAPTAEASTEPVPDAATLEEPAAPAPTAGGEEIAPPTNMTEVAQQETPAAITDLDEQPRPAVRSLQKVAATPWKVGRKWINGIYFARPGDSLSSISQTIYGDDRTSELKKVNPTYNNRDVKPGDKVYYASVVRPEDAEKVLTFFEEKNIPPKIYTAQEGDNIRRVSKNLLGYPEAWKEVWAYNQVESKQDIDAGTEIRYWDTNMASSMPSDQAPSQPMADTGATPPPMPDQAPPQDMPVANQDFPPPPDFPPPTDGQQTADLPPPPPPMDIPPPPPMDIPPPPPQAVASVDDGASGAAGDDQLIMLGGGGAVLVALLLFLVRRKRKQKELEQALGETHVG
jgi:LPXTG-motif cell wall-anchored protein